MATTDVNLASSISGNVANPSNAIGVADASVAGDANSWTHRWRFTNPDIGTDVVSGTQTLNLLVAKNSSSTKAFPSITSVELFVNGTSKGIISASSHTVENSLTNYQITFASTLLDSLTNIEIELITLSDSGGPNKRGVVIDSATLTVNHEPAATGPTVYVNVGGTWYPGEVFVNVGGSWKNANDLNVNIGGTWKAWTS